MFGLSFWEILIVAFLALILIGPDNLPEAARTLGKGLRQFRRVTEDLKDQIETEIYADELKRKQLPVAPVPAAKEPVGGEVAEDAATAPSPAGVPSYLPGFSAPEDPPAPVEPAAAPSQAEEPGGPTRS